MRLEVPAKALLAAAKLCLPVVPGRTTNEALKCLRIDAAPGRVTVSATDLEVGVRAHVSATDLLAEGVAVLPADKLVSVLTEAGPLSVTIDVDEDTARVRVGKARYTLPVYPADQFPEVEGFDIEKPHYAVSGPELAAALGRVRFAADPKDSVWWATTGALIELRSDPVAIRFVCTDTKRLAVVDAPATSHEGDPPVTSGLLPRKAVELLERVAAADSGSVLIDLRNRQVYARTSTATVHAVLQEGKFPPYAQIIPKAAPLKLSVPVSELLASIRKAAITVDQESKRVTCKFESGRVTISAAGAATGSSEVELDLPGYDGAELTIAFDPVYLTDYLRSIDGEASARLEMTSDHRPAVFKAGERSLYLVMPLAG
jgi:DNA polymerase-3 subunit beta